MKILYISVFEDGTGYGEAARQYALAMDAVGLDVVIRSVKFKGDVKLTEKLRELSDKDSRGATHCITHLLPHMFEYNGNFEKNIGMFASETTNFSGSSWATHLNLMDEAWVFNEQQADCCYDSNVNVPVKVIAHACNVEKYTTPHDRLPLPIPEDDFVFYTIGEFGKRKNFTALVKAFHLEFSPQEPVQLVIKTSLGGTLSESQQQISTYLDGIKQGMKLYNDTSKYKREVVILEKLSEEQICQLHTRGDCYVASSYGEAWNIPCYDAMGFGKTPIFTNWSGHCEYLSGKEGYPCGFSIEPCFGVVEGFRDLYSSRESWASINIDELRSNMRLAYEDTSDRMRRSIAGRERAFMFSHHNVGKIIKKALEGTE